jgi:hypothetical protein
VSIAIRSTPVFEQSVGPAPLRPMVHPVPGEPIGLVVSVSTWLVPSSVTVSVSTCGSMISAHHVRVEPAANAVSACARAGCSAAMASRASTAAARAFMLRLVDPARVATPDPRRARPVLEAEARQRRQPYDGLRVAQRSGAPMTSRSRTATSWA